MACRLADAIIWTNAGILLIEPFRANFSEILIERKCIWNLNDDTATIRKYCMKISMEDRDQILNSL